MDMKLSILIQLALMASVCLMLTQSRQIRYSRYHKEIIENEPEGSLDQEKEIQATVREVKLAPYPASGVRPGRAFRLPKESAEQDAITQSSLDATTVDLDLTTTEQYDSTTFSSLDTTTLDSNLNNAEEASGDDQLNTDYQPQIPFLLPAANLEDDEQTLEKPDDERKDKALKNPDLIVVLAKSAPYPAAGYRPSKAFLLPTEREENQAGHPLELDESSLDREESNEQDDDTIEITVKAAPYPAAGYKPSKSFLLPGEIEQSAKPEEANQNEDPELSITLEEVKQDENTIVLKVKSAPYPPAGYRPGKAFLLPNEELKSESQIKIEEEKETPKEDESKINNEKSNSSHPPCGSSTNPLAPTHLQGQDQVDPNSENIFIQQPRIAVAVPASAARLIVQPMRLRSARLLAQPVVVARPLVYTSQWQSW